MRKYHLQYIDTFGIIHESFEIAQDLKEAKWITERRYRKLCPILFVEEKCLPVKEE